MQDISSKLDSFASIEIILQEMGRIKDLLAGEPGDACAFVGSCLDWATAKGLRAMKLGDALGNHGVREIEKTILSEILRSIVVLDRQQTPVRLEASRRLRECIWLRVADDATLLDPNAAASEEDLAQDWKENDNVPGALVRRDPGGIRLAVMPPFKKNSRWTALLGPTSIGDFESADDARLAVETASEKLRSIPASTFHPQP